MVRQEKGASCVHLSEMQAYVRVETGDEEALIAGLLRTASEMCEGFINQALIARPFEQQLLVQEEWTLLGLQPVRAVHAIRLLSDNQVIDPLSYRIDIDHEGRGFVRGLPVGKSVVIEGVAGMAADSNGVPEPLRQGIMLLAASLFTHRDSPADGLPVAVSSLWRPYRRAGLCR